MEIAIEDKFYNLISNEWIDLNIVIQKLNIDITEAERICKYLIDKEMIDRYYKDYIREKCFIRKSMNDDKLFYEVEMLKRNFEDYPETKKRLSDASWKANVSLVLSILTAIISVIIWIYSQLYPQ